jgi:7-cyano-7-deazaguanine synthase in queuosine biosynthesis
MNRKSLVLLSGGLDSSVLLNWLQRERQTECSALFINWGQSAAHRERATAEAVAKRSGVRLDAIDVSDWRRGFRDRFSNMLLVPRNAVFIHLALPYALADRCQSIAVGSTPEDAEVVDSNRSFFSGLNHFWKQLGQSITVDAPFLDSDVSKVDIIRWADKALGCDFVDATSSCWRETPCPETEDDWCAACIKRHLALKAARA